MSASLAFVSALMAYAPLARIAARVASAAASVPMGYVVAIAFGAVWTWTRDFIRWWDR